MLRARAMGSRLYVELLVVHPPPSSRHTILLELHYSEVYEFVEEEEIPAGPMDLTIFYFNKCGNTAGYKSLLGHGNS